MEYLEKPIQSPYLDWIKSGQKTFEGRLKSKIDEWNLKIGMKIKFYDQDNKSLYVIVKVTSLLIFSDFGEAYDNLKDKLIPFKSRDEVIDLYNGLSKILVLFVLDLHLFKIIDILFLIYLFFSL